MGMVRPHDITYDLGTLVVRSIGSQAAIEHGVEDPAVHRLESVANVGQSPRHDDRHGVLEERPLHLLLNLNRFNRPTHGLVTAGGRTVPAARA